MQVNIFYKVKISSYYHKTGIYKKAVLKALGSCCKQKGELNIFIVSSQEILEINKTYLGHNYITDVITFPYPSSQAQDNVFGDIIVCFDKARSQAKELKHSICLELLTLIIHGTLHLVGYDDKTLISRAKMNNLAEEISKQFLNF